MVLGGLGSVAAGAVRSHRQPVGVGADAILGPAPHSHRHRRSLHLGRSSHSIRFYSSWVLIGIHFGRLKCATGLIDRFSFGERAVVGFFADGNVPLRVQQDSVVPRSHSDRLRRRRLHSGGSDLRKAVRVSVLEQHVLHPPMRR